jgi:hypothetical protein
MDDLLAEVNASIKSDESTGFRLNEDLESAINEDVGSTIITRTPYSFSQKEVQHILASGDINLLRLLHIAIWRELGILGEDGLLSPLPLQQAAQDSVKETDESVKLEPTEGDGSNATAGKTEQIRNGNSSDNIKVEACINGTVSHQSDNHNNASDPEVALNPVVSTPPSETSSQTHREEASLAKRWADLVVVSYRHPKWRKMVEDIEKRDEDDDDTWENMQDLLDA